MDSAGGFHIHIMALSINEDFHRGTFRLHDNQKTTNAKCGRDAKNTNLDNREAFRA